MVAWMQYRQESVSDTKFDFLYCTLRRGMLGRLRECCSREQSTGMAPCADACNARPWTHLSCVSTAAAAVPPRPHAGTHVLEVFFLVRVHQRPLGLCFCCFQVLFVFCCPCMEGLGVLGREHRSSALPPPGS
jgi:hypothetical protein